MELPKSAFQAYPRTDRNYVSGGQTVSTQLTQTDLVGEKKLRKKKKKQKRRKK